MYSGVECSYFGHANKIIPTVSLTADASNETKQMINNVSRHWANIIGLAKVCNFSKNLELYVSLKDIACTRIYEYIVTDFYENSI